MKNEVLGSCPVCQSELSVSKLHCDSCNTSIEGEFNLCKFCKLSKEDKDFIEVFLVNRGNIKEIEKELGISYPTVRGKLDNVVSALGHKPSSKSNINHESILEKLDAGKINSNEALKLLKGQDLGGYYE